MSAWTMSSAGTWVECPTDGLQATAPPKSAISTPAQRRLATLPSRHPWSRLRRKSTSQALGKKYANEAIGVTQPMGSDVPPERFQPMRSVYLSPNNESTDDTERISKLLSGRGRDLYADGKGVACASLRHALDRFGTSWRIVHQKPMPANG